LQREGAGETLWFQASGGWFVSFSIATGKYEIRGRDTPIDLAISDGYVYWTSEYKAYGIKRMPLDAPALYTLK
jgi:hypothetical protein